MSDQDVAKVRLAYARLFSDNPQPGDGKTVLADLALRSGYFDVPSISAWMKQAKSTEGYEINCHELSGKRALFKAIKDSASLTESEMLWLEQVARLAPAGD